MGVEPTRDRLAAPHGFEVRTPHRGRFSSIRIVMSFREMSKQVQAGRVDSTPIAPAQGHAVAIKELENLDGDLSPVGHAIAKPRAMMSSRRRMCPSLDDQACGTGSLTLCGAAVTCLRTASGHFQTFGGSKRMSTLPPKADIG